MKFQCNFNHYFLRIYSTLTPFMTAAPVIIMKPIITWQLKKQHRVNCASLNSTVKAM
jgi:hypothetical protein